MNKALKIFFILIFLSNCSFNENSKLWNKEKNEILNEPKNLKKVLNKENIELKEFNPLLKIDFPKIKYTNKVYDSLNDFGSLKYDGGLNKIGGYKFSKLKNFNQYNYEPLILNDGLIIFDKKGNILRFNDNQKIIWKNNFYSKSEKKLKPILSFAINKKNLIVADDIANIFSIDINSGELNWLKKITYPSNSEIKIYKDQFFIVDYKNILRCFYLRDGSECWNLKTEDSFTVSNSKYSLIIKDDLVIFNNSIGDITAVNIDTGFIKWQLPTQKNSIINETYNFYYSKLVSDGNSIYFSNNKNQFYSVDLISGTTNWINNVSSDLTPIIIDDYIFTVSESGFLFIIQKKEGNIIKINDIYKNYELKKRKKIKPTGFKIGKNKLYLTNTNGNLIVIDLTSGNISKIQKLSGDLISKPFIYNGYLFVVKNGSVIQYD